MRLRQGRTAVQLARFAQVERSQLSRIERNVLSPNFDTVLRILRNLELKASSFISLGGEQAKRSPSEFSFETASA
jgi:transcriptional regulator with XRE-family HTH domain